MPIEAELADGRVLEFPDGTDPSVIQATVKRMIGAAPAQDNAFVSGFKSYLPQLQETFGGIKTLAGVAAERAIGEGDISKGLIESGRASMAEAQTAQQGLATPERGSFSDALAKGVGSVLTEWLPYQAGSGAANILEALAVTGAGALAGTAAAPGAGTAIGAGTGLVARELAKRGIKEAAEQVIKEQGEEAAKDFFAKEASKVAAEIGAKYAARGQAAALGTQAGFYGAGQTTSRAVEEAQTQGGTASDIELSRVLPAAAVSGVAEFISDKIGLGALKGMDAPGKSLVMNIAKSIALAGTKEAPTEVIQAVAERYGAKLSLDDAAALKEYIDSAAAAYAMSVAPGAVGGARGTMQYRAEEAAKPEVETIPPVAPEAAAPEVVTIPPVTEAPVAEATPEQKIVEETTGVSREQAPSAEESADVLAGMYRMDDAEGRAYAERMTQERLLRQQKEIDADAERIAELNRRQGIVSPEAPPAEITERPSMAEAPPEVTPREELLAKQAEVDRRRLEAGLPTGESSVTPGLKPAEVVAEEPKPVPKLVDNRPMAERAAKNRLLVMKNMLANQGGDPQSLTIVPHPTATGKFAIQSLDVPTKFATNLPRTAITRPETPTIIDPVNAYVEVQRRTNTPAARKFISDFESGNITREDVALAVEQERKASKPQPLTYTNTGAPGIVSAEVSKPRGARDVPKFGEQPPVIEAPPEEPPGEEPPPPTSTQPQTLQEFEQRMPIVFDKAEVRAANAAGNFTQLTKALQLSTNPAIRRIGQLGGGIASKITLRKPGRLDPDIAGVYMYADDSIKMIPSHAGNEHTNAHETLHALLSKAQRYPTERQKPIVLQIEKLFDHVKKELLRSGKAKYVTGRGGKKYIVPYGLTNAREFTAEAMTNPEFQYELMQIPYRGKKSAWTQFVKLVADLLGIQNTNALTEVMNLVDRLAMQKQPRKTVTDKELVDKAIAAEEPTEEGANQQEAQIAPPLPGKRVPQSDLTGPAVGGAPAKAAPAKGLTAVAEKATAKAQQLLQKQKVPTTGLDHIPEDLRAMTQPIFFPQNKTVLDRIDGMKDKFWQRVAQGVADQYRTIKEYSPVAYMQARISKSIDGALEGLMLHGHVFNDGGALNIRANTKGMLKVLEPVGKELDSYLMWVALNREFNLPEPKRSKAPNMDKLIANRAKFSAGELNGKSRLAVYESVAKEMNAINKSVLDVALQNGLINEQGYKDFSSNVYYIPFYRRMEGGDLEAVQGNSGLTSQDFSEELKGGEAPFGDLMENILRNWSHILSASMKNQAATTTLEAAMKQNAAVPNLKPGFEWKDGKVYSTQNGKLYPEEKDKNGKVLYKEGELRPSVTKSEAGMAKIVKDGQVMYFKVTEPLLMEAISSIGYLGPKSKFLDVARDFKNLLQFGVTLSPTFKVNNLIRDSVAAMGVSELAKDPISNIRQGISLSDPNSRTYISALAGGAIFNFGSAYEGDQAKMIKRLLDKGVSRNTILDSDNLISKGLRVTWDKYQEWGNKSEAANRLALYKQMTDKDMSHLEASFMARDLLDFSMQGSWPAFRMVTQVVPFMNARIQGLYKLGRDGIIPTYRVLYNTATGKELNEEEKDQQKKDKLKAQAFLTVTAAVGLASAVLYLAFKDDEDFKKRDQWDRDNFWWFKLPGMDVAYRVPKPFEIGAFGTLVERTLEQIFDSGAEGKQFTDSLSRTLWDTFSMNPTPQMIKPLLDIYANKDSFTGAPIESAGLERLSKQERQIDSTSFFAKVLGGVSTVFPEKFEMSPVQMDYMIKAYLGWMGGTAAVISTYAVAPFREGEYPDARWLDRLSLGLAKELPTAQSKYVTAFYDSNKEISQAFADMRHYAEAGDSEKVQRILEERGDKIALAKFYDKTAKSMASVRQQINIVTKDATMGGAEKKMEIDRLKQIISTLAQQAEEVRKSMKK
jgi:hypothetical protein